MHPSEFPGQDQRETFWTQNEDTVKQVIGPAKSCTITLEAAPGKNEEPWPVRS